MSVWKEIRFLRKSYESRTIRLLYVAYCLAGGFYRSDVATRAFTYGWYGATIIGTSYGLVFGFIGSLLTNDLTFSDILFMVAIWLAIVYICIFAPSVFLLCLPNINEIVKEAEVGFNCPEPEVRISDPKRKKYDSYTRGIVFGLFMILSAHLLYPSTNVFYLALFCDNTCLHSQIMYFMSTPYTNHINSVGVYLAVWGIQVLVMMINIQTATGALVFGLMIACELYNALVNVVTELHHVIDDTILELKSIQTREKSIADSDSYEKFKTNLGTTISRYQNVIRMIELLKPWIETMFTINLVSFVAIETSCLYLLLVMECDPFYKFKACVGLWSINVGLYWSSYLGEIFEDMESMMIEGVYFTHWDELPVRYRKMIHILLSQTQHTNQYYAFKMYPLSMNTYARTCNLVYALVNFLRTRAMK